MSSSAFAGLPQVPSRYSLIYRLARSPPSDSQTTDEDPESQIAESPITTSALETASQQQPQMSSSVDGNLFVAGSHSGQALDWSEINDVAVLRSSPTTSKRFAETISKFVSRGLKQQPQAGEGHGAAAKYYLDLAIALEGIHDFSAEQAAKAHDLMVDGWLQHVSEIVGQHLRSPERIVGFLDDVITNAEMMGGAQPPAMLRLALHNAISSVECPAPPTPHSQPDRRLPRDEDMNQHSVMDVTNGNADDAEMADAETVPSASALQHGHVEEPVTPSSKRFSTARSFFLHHSVRVKKPDGGWVQETGKTDARSRAKVEWNKMEMRTKSEWDGLWACYDRGDKSKASAASTAHLFRDGVAICVWSSTNTSSPVAEAGPSSRGNDAAAIDTPRDKTRIRPAALAPRLDQYRQIGQPERVSFLALDPAKPIEGSDLAKACRSALTARRDGDMNTYYSNGLVFDQLIFTIRWHDTKASRLFEGTVVRSGSQKLRAQAYPDAPPQIFVAHMKHISENGIRVDAVHPAIAHAIPDHPSHLRHEKIGRSNDTVWIVVFQDAPHLLRFAVGIQTKIDNHSVVDFEPLMRSAACPVCHQAHSAVDCDLLEKAGKSELGLKKKGLQNYLGKMPELS